MVRCASRRTIVREECSLRSGMIHHRLFVHVVWTTRNRAPLISASLAEFLWGYLPAIAFQERSHIVELGMVSTHVHLLLRLDVCTTIPRLIQRMKGGSSRIADKEGHAKGGTPSAGLAATASRRCMSNRWSGLVTMCGARRTDIRRRPFRGGRGTPFHEPAILPSHALPAPQTQSSILHRLRDRAEPRRSAAAQLRVLPIAAPADHPRPISIARTRHPRAANATAQLISAIWVKAWGKFPRNSPVAGSSSSE